MQQWQLLEQIFTVKDIMTPSKELLTWDGETPLIEIQRKAQEYKFDTIPMLENGIINSFLKNGSDVVQPMTCDWLVARDTPIPKIVSLFVSGNKRSLFIISGQDIVGLVTPADLNKLPARTYFYNLIAALEITITEQIQEQKLTHHEIFTLLGKDTKRQKEILKMLEDSDLKLDIVHTLYLPEMVKIIRKNEQVRKRLGFSSGENVKNQIGGLVEFRNTIMHPTKPILSDETGIQDLNKYINRIQALLEQITSTE